MKPRWSSLALAKHADLVVLSGHGVEGVDEQEHQVKRPTAPCVDSAKVAAHGRDGLATRLRLEPLEHLGGIDAPHVEPASTHSEALRTSPTKHNLKRRTNFGLGLSHNWRLV